MPITVTFELDDDKLSALLAALGGGSTPKAAKSAPAAASAAPGASPAPAPAPAAAPTPQVSAATPNPAPVTMPMAQPAEQPATPQTGADMSQVTAALSGYIGRHSASAAKAVLVSLGVGSAKELQPHQYAAAVAALSA